MDDLDVLARDYGLGARGKANPMRSTPADRRSIDDPLFSDVFGGQPKYGSSSSSPNNNIFSTPADFDYDSIFQSSAASEPKASSNKPSSVPVYDKPKYDEDIFDGLPGLKSKSEGSTVRLDDDLFGSISSHATGEGKNEKNDLDDLLGNFGKTENFDQKTKSSNAKGSSFSAGFDDLLAGFGTSSSTASNRQVPESRWSSVPVSGSKHNTLDDPFVVLEARPNQQSSSEVFTDPLEEIGKLNKSKSATAEASSGGGGAFDDIDPLGNIGKSVPSFSSGSDYRGNDESFTRSPTHQSATSSAPVGNHSYQYSDDTEKKVPLDNFQEPPLFDVPNISTDFQKSFGQTAPPPQYNETDSQVDMSPTSGEGQQSDDIWLTVEDIPLFTQPSTTPPPSRPPPPIPRQTSRSETGSYPSSSRKKGEEYYPPPNYSQYSQSSKLASSAAKSPSVSQFDELEEFAMGGRSQNNFESANFHTSAESDAFSASAAASAAAMKDAMDKAEAKFRQAREVCERESVKAARNRVPTYTERDEPELQERDLREAQERFEHERKQKEEEERERRRLERERQREIEREQARQAVERATREARERAAAEARERAATEARLRAERAAVEKANAEARLRAERAAVQRAQAEARERAAAEAKERAEKAAAAEAREKELQEKAAAEARRRAERAAVERAAAEARERAAAEARERAAAEARERAAAEARERAAAEAREKAAAAAKMNQQRNDNDLESFFSMGRASSVPRSRTTPPDPFFDQQFQNMGGFEAAKKTPSTGASSNIKKASSTSNFVDDLSSIFGAAPSGEFQDVEGETEERRRARLDRHQRTQERAAKALAEKNQRDLQAQKEQEERHRIAETLDIEIKRWAAGKEGNLRALLSTLQYVLWPECGWQPVSLTDLITGAAVKKAYRKATLCIHPDKVQQKGATLQQKYIAEKVFDLLKEAWNKFNSEELF